MGKRLVIALNYRVTCSKEYSFRNAAPIEHETEQFTLRVENEVARFALKEPVSDALAAREFIDPYVQAWEWWSALNHWNCNFHLRFASVDLAEIGPLPPSGYARMTLPALTQSGGNIGGDFRDYPAPPAATAVGDADVNVMAYRYWLYIQGRDSLASMANFCLTVLEAAAGQQNGKRRAAAAKYGIAISVLNKIGVLAAKKGGRDARKADGLTDEFTESERRWLECAIREVIHRATELADDTKKNMDHITIESLPNG